MKISKELQSQIERYNKTRSFALGQELLSELDELYQAQTEKKLNKRCGTCVRDAMRRISSIQPEPQKKVEFLGVKQPSYEEMTFKEVKDIARAKGQHGNWSKDKIIQWLREQ